MRKVLWSVVFTLAGILGLAVLALLALRLYYHDERVRQMSEVWLSERLQTEVVVGGLSMSLWSGVEIVAVRVGSLQGFTHETLGFERLAARWSPLDLLILCVRFDEVALTGVRFTLEENAVGRNVDQMIALLLRSPPPPAPTPPEEAEPAVPPAAPSEAKPLAVEPISLPVRVRVDRLAFSVAHLRIERPDTSIVFEHAGVEGRFDGQGEALWLDLWLGLGEHADASAKSRLRVRGKGMPFDVDSEQRVDLKVRTRGLAHVRTTLALSIDAQLGRTRKPVPAQSVRSEMEAAADLLAQRLDLKTLTFSLNRGTTLDIALAAERLFWAPRFRIGKLVMRSDLNELAPLVAGFAPQMAVGGRVEIDGASVDANAVKVALRLRDVRARLPGTTVTGVSADAQLRADPEQASVHWETKVAAVLAAAQKVDRVTLVADVATPLAPWLRGTHDGTVDATIDLGVAGVSSAQATVRGVSVSLEAHVPAALVHAAPDAEPLRSKTRLRVREIKAGAATVQSVDLTVDATLMDLAGNHLDAEVALAVAHTTLAQDGEPLTLSNTRLTLAAARQADRFVLHRLRLVTADALTLDAKGDVAGALGPAPRVSGLVVDMTAEDLSRVLAVLPAAARPLDRLSGSLRIAFRLDGRVPYKDLMRQAAPPAPPAGDVAQMVQSYADYLDTWRRQLATGLPFLAALELTLQDVALANSTSELSGLDLTTGFELQRHGPVLRNRVRVQEVRRPVGAKEITHEASFVFDPDGFALTAGAAMASLSGAGLTQPARDSKAAISLRYRIGGDLLLDELLLASPDLGVRVEASGVVSKPLRFALARGWGESGLPGMDATLRFLAGMALPAPATLVTGGPELAGAIDLAGSLRAAAGVVTLEGLLSAKHFGVAQSDFVVHEMSGGLPFDLRVAFDPRDDATVLRRNVPVGGGVLAVITSGDDISQRPARPDYYDRLRPYRRQAGLTIAKVKSGPYEVTDIALEGRLSQGMLLFDWLALHVLGGDVTGNLALQLGRDRSLRGDLNFDLSNIDASNFEGLDLKPGPDSELNADLQVGFLFAPKRRDLTLNMNVTRIGPKTLDRFLQLIDPTGKNEGVQSARSKLWLVRIDSVAAWIRYENFNMDLAATPFLRIPGTQLSIGRIDREIVRRHSLSDTLDAYLQPHIDNSVAPLLGWAFAQ